MSIADGTIEFKMPEQPLIAKAKGRILIYWHEHALCSDYTAPEWKQYEQQVLVSIKDCIGEMTDAERKEFREWIHQIERK